MSEADSVERAIQPAAASFPQRLVARSETSVPASCEGAEVCGTSGLANVLIEDGTTLQDLTLEGWNHGDANANAGRTEDHIVKPRRRGQRIDARQSLRTRMCSRRSWSTFGTVSSEARTLELIG